MTHHDKRLASSSWAQLTPGHGNGQRVALVMPYHESWPMTHHDTRLASSSWAQLTPVHDNGQRVALVVYVEHKVGRSFGAEGRVLALHPEVGHGLQEAQQGFKKGSWAKATWRGSWAKVTWRGSWAKVTCRG